MKKWMVILSVLLIAPALTAQDVLEDVIIEPAPLAAPEGPAPPAPAGGPEPPLPPDTFVFLSQGFGHHEEVVKDAPYSAQAVTERAQVLSDGNRIYQKNSDRVYRDSQGRTRREHSIGNLGFWAAEEPRKTAMIHDPVAEVRYVLDAQERTARRLKFDGKGPMMARKHPGGAPPPKPGPRPFEAPIPPGHAPHVMKLPPLPGEPKTESLGKKVIEGVQAEGTRTVTRIEAGKIGNERPIEIVSEKWYSPELKLNILTRHNDPRFGETLYRLTNIKRDEPDASLFLVPGGYRILNEP